MAWLPDQVARRLIEGPEAGDFYIVNLGQPSELPRSESMQTYDWEVRSDCRSDVQLPVIWSTEFCGVLLSTRAFCTFSVCKLHEFGVALAWLPFSRETNDVRNNNSGSSFCSASWRDQPDLQHLIRLRTMTTCGPSARAYRCTPYPEWRPAPWEMLMSPTADRYRLCYSRQSDGGRCFQTRISRGGMLPHRLATVLKTLAYEALIVWPHPLDQSSKIGRF